MSFTGHSTFPILPCVTHPPSTDASFSIQMNTKFEITSRGDKQTLTSTISITPCSGHLFNKVVKLQRKHTPLYEGHCQKPSTRCCFPASGSTIMISPRDFVKVVLSYENRYRMSRTISGIPKTLCPLKIHRGVMLLKSLGNQKI